MQSRTGIRRQSAATTAKMRARPAADRPQRSERAQAFGAYQGLRALRLALHALARALVIPAQLCLLDAAAPPATRLSRAHSSALGRARRRATRFGRSTKRPSKARAREPIATRG